MIYIQLFYTFFKIGLFGFGGGYAMLSMIQGDSQRGSGKGICRGGSHSGCGRL